VGTFFIQNFGCRTTQAEGAALATGLMSRGLRPATRREAELVILNTCTVTAAADDDVRRSLRRVRRENPAARILVTGCYAQRAPQELAAFPGVAWVVGNSHKSDVADLVSGPSPCRCLIQVGDPGASSWAAAEVSAEDRTRPNLKVQDGCSARCAFCLIPLVRGRSRSAPPEWVVAQVRRLSERYREVVLSGINLGRWGRDLQPRLRLADLVRRLLEETPVERLRLSSVEPMDLSDALLELIAGSPRMARHLHVPLESGCDAVLRRMRRWYRTRHYENRIRAARQRIPEAALGADVLVGFPGETDAEFDQTRRFLERLPLTYLHVFTFSARPGTEAAAMPRQVPMRVRRQRNRILRELGAAANLAFRQRMVGRTLSVVTLGTPRAALSDNYLKVELASAREPNRLIEVHIGDLTEKGLREGPRGVVRRH
jgi:threonylcarbamoyladenosine tRNA methylthiotransferase MtaB